MLFVLSFLNHFCRYFTIMLCLSICLLLKTNMVCGLWCSNAMNNNKEICNIRADVYFIVLFQHQPHLMLLRYFCCLTQVCLLSTYSMQTYYSCLLKRLHDRKLREWRTVIDVCNNVMGCNLNKKHAHGWFKVVHSKANIVLLLKLINITGFSKIMSFK